MNGTLNADAAVPDLAGVDSNQLDAYSSRLQAGSTWPPLLLAGHTACLELLPKEG